jgi:hypothetical protein
MPSLVECTATLPALLCEIKANLLDEEEMKYKMVNFLTDTVRQMDSTGGLGQPEHLLQVRLLWLFESP